MKIPNIVMIGVYFMLAVSIIGLVYSFFGDGTLAGDVEKQLAAAATCLCMFAMGIFLVSTALDAIDARVYGTDRSWKSLWHDAFIIPFFLAAIVVAVYFAESPMVYLRLASSFFAGSSFLLVFITS